MALRRLLAVLLAMVLLAAACGGGDDEDGAGDDDAGVSADESVGDSDAQETDGADENDEPMSGDSGSDWCDAVREAQENPDESPLSFDFFGMTPEQLEEQFNKNVGVMDDWADLAPDEIKGDVEILAGAFRAFVEFGDDADWDVMAMSENPEFAAAFDDPEIERAGDRLDQYSEEVCGVDLDGGFDAGVSDEPTAPQVSDDADLIDQLFQAMGISASGFIPAEVKDCMNEQLVASGAFPDGIGTGFIVDEEAIDALDEAATACGFDGL